MAGRRPGPAWPAHNASTWRRSVPGLLLALLSLFLLFQVSHSIIIITDSNNFTTKCTTALSSAWPSPFSPRDLLGSSNLTLLSPGRPGDNVSGAIVLIPSWKAIYLSETALMFQRRGALALVISTSFEEGGRTIWTTRFQYRTDAQIRREITIPIFQVIDSQCRKAINTLLEHQRKGLETYATLNNEENYNGYAVLADSPLGIAFQLLFGVPPVLGVILVIYRIIPIVRLEPNRRESLVSLSLIGLGHIFRILFALDPHGMRSILTPYFILFFSSTHVAVVLICDLVILFHWNSALNSFGARKLDWLRKYVFIFLGLVVALEITFSTLRMFEIAPAVIFAFQVFYILVELAVVVFISYTAFGLYKYLHGTTEEKKTRQASYEFSRLVTENLPDSLVIFRMLVVKMTRLLVASSFFLLILILTTVGIALAPFRHAVSEMAIWLVGITAMNIIGILQTLVIREGRDPIKEREKASRSRSKNSTGLRTRTFSSAGTLAGSSVTSLSPTRSAKFDTERSETVQSVRGRTTREEIDDLFNSEETIESQSRMGSSKQDSSSNSKRPRGSSETVDIEDKEGDQVQSNVRGQQDRSQSDSDPSDTSDSSIGV